MKLSFSHLPLLLCFAFLSIGISAQQKLNANFYLQDYIEQHGDSETPIGLFIKGNKNDIISYAKDHKGLYRGSIKGWHYIRIPSKHIEDLLLSETASEINFRPYKGEAMNDTMRVNNRINQIHAGASPLDVPYTGEDIVLGFIDTGIDWLHPDFQNADGSTRILSIWDQTLGNNQYTPSVYGYGQHWDSVLINQNIPTNNDQWGHGTTVSGAAAGNGLANGRNKGVAPKADIIMVETNFNAPDWLATVADAVEYIYHIADSLSKPCVINASVGTYLGSHDALDPYALYIDSLILSKRGHLFVASAGNSGDDEAYHLHHDVTQDTTFTFFEINPSAATGGADVFFELWADSVDFNQVHFTMGADKISPTHSFRGRGNFFTVEGRLNMVSFDTIRNDNDDILGTIMYWIEPRDAQYFMQVYMPSPDSSDYIFRLESYGTGAFDGWNSSDYGFSNMLEHPDTIPGFADMASYTAPDSLQSIVSSFQCSPNVITVGNYVNDSGYVNNNSNWMPANGLVRGELANSSSIGPARTGILKPEVAASGTAMNSAFPLFHINNFITNGIDSLLAEGGMHYRNGGTSMSSPVVAGLGALFLEKCPNATQADFIKAVINNVYTDSFTGTTPNFAFGYGKLDGFATLVDAHYTAEYTGDLDICDGDSNLITINGDNTSYLWSTGGTDSTEYFLDDSEAFFNASTTNCISDTVFIDFNLLAKPMITNNTSPYEYCEMDTVNINLDGVFTILGYSDGNTDNPRTFNSPFSGWVLVGDSLGCVSDTNFIDVNELALPPVPVISLSGDQLSTAGGATLYEWYTADGTSVFSSTDSTYTLIANGSYYVEVYNADLCSSISDTITFSNVGIGELDGLELEVFPNPSDGNFTVRTSKNVNITLYNHLGEIIKLEQAINNTYYINNLSQGSYILKVSDGKGFDIRKIIVFN